MALPLTEFLGLRDACEPPRLFGLSCDLDLPAIAGDTSLRNVQLAMWSKSFERARTDQNAAVARMNSRTIRSRIPTIALVVTGITVPFMATHSLWWTVAFILALVGAIILPNPAFASRLNAEDTAVRLERSFNARASIQSRRDSALEEQRERQRVLWRGHLRQMEVDSFHQARQPGLKESRSDPPPGHLITASPHLTTGPPATTSVLPSAGTVGVRAA